MRKMPVSKGPHSAPLVLIAQNYPEERKAPYLTADCSFKVDVETWGKGWTQKDILDHIDLLCEFVPFQVRNAPTGNPEMLRAR